MLVGEFSKKSINMTAFNGHMALYQHKRDMYDTVWSITLGSRGKLQRGKRINDGKRRMTILYLGGPVWECDIEQ